MENKKGTTNWFKMIGQTALTVVVTLAVGGVASLFAIETANINVHDSIKMDSDVFVTSIHITNHNKNTQISNLQIYALNNVVFTDIYSDNKVIAKDDNYNIEMKSIPPNSSNSIVIYTNKPLNKENIRFSYDGKITIRYANEEKPITKTTIIFIFIIGVMQSIVLIIMRFLQERMFEKNEAKHIQRSNYLKEKADGLDKTLQVSLDDIDKQEKQLYKLKKDSYKLKLFYIAKISDYKKELDFWKDTIRKMLYQSGVKSLDTENIFYIVTKNLKTFGVSKNEDKFDEIAYLADKMVSQKQPTITEKLLLDDLDE